MTDWLHKYPHALALLQRPDDEVLWGDQEESARPAAGPDDPETVLAYLREVYGFCGRVSVTEDPTHGGHLIRLEGGGRWVEARAVLPPTTTRCGRFAATLDALGMRWVAAQGAR